MAASIERVADELRAHGYTVTSIDIKPDGSGVNGLTFPRDTPLTTQAAGLAYLATEFDWSDAGERAWKAASIRAAAKLLLTSNDPAIVVIRSVGLALMATGQDTRRNDNIQIARINEIAARVNAALDLDPPIGPDLAPLPTGDTVASALEQVAEVIATVGVVGLEDPE